MYSNLKLKHGLTNDKQGIEVIRLVFDLHYDYRLTTPQIADLLKEMNLVNRFGNYYKFQRVADILNDESCRKYLSRKQREKINLIENWNIQKDDLIPELKRKYIV